MRFISLICLIAFPAMAAATTPPTAAESVICTVSGTVFEFSDVQEKTTHINDNIKKYSNPSIWESSYTKLRLDVESTTRTPCAGFMPDVIAEYIPLCQKGFVALRLGQALTGKVMQQNYGNNGGMPCLDIQ